MHIRALLVLTLALLPPGASAGSPGDGTTADCVDPAGLVACVEGTVQGSFKCTRFDADHVSCWANGTWAYRGYTGLPGVVAGDAARAGGLTVSWCDIGGLCRSVGLGLLIVGCDWRPGEPCGDSFAYDMWLGTPAIGAGECIDFTFAPWIYVWGDFSPAAAATAVKKFHEVVEGRSGPALQVSAEPSATYHVCN